MNDPRGSLTISGEWDTDATGTLAVALPGSRQVWFYPEPHLGGHLAKGLTFKATMSPSSNDSADPVAFTLQPSGPVRRCLKVWRWQFAYGKPLPAPEAP